MLARELIRRLLSEMLGTAMIVATVVGTGHMVARLESDPTVALILMALAVGGTLFGVITILMPISGAHLNPVVTIISGIQGRIAAGLGTLYVVFQILGAVLGVLLANLMFMSEPFSQSDGSRANPGSFLGEVVATFGLLLIILMLSERSKLELIPASVALWIVSGHFFTSSTSLANPAVTIGRAFTDNTTGVDWNAAAAFIPLQIIGGLLALLVFKIFYPTKKENHV